MNIELIGEPICQVNGNAASEVASVFVTRDDGTTEATTTKAIIIRLGSLTAEAFLTDTEGATNLSLLVFQTTGVCGEGEVGKMVNRAVLDDSGNLAAVNDEPWCVTETEYATTEDLFNFIEQQIQVAQAEVKAEAH